MPTHGPEEGVDRRQFLLGLAGASAALASSTGRAADVRLAAKEYFLARMASEHIPGLAVAVVRGRELVWSQGFGWANIEKRIPMTPDTIQNIGSVSKTFAATAAMQLFEAGRLKLDDHVNRHLDFVVEHPVHPSTPITIRHLLTHQSSIEDGPAYAQAYACSDPVLSLEEWLRAYLLPSGRFYDAQRNFHEWAPGRRFSYNNVAYGLLGHVVERLSGMSFEDYCQKKIFQPFGMTETSWYLRGIDRTRHSIPYSWVSGGKVRGPTWGGLPPSVVGDPDAATRVNDDYAANCFYNHPNVPDGFLRTSVHQLVRYAQAYLGKTGRGDSSLLRADTIASMFQQISGDEGHVFGLCWNASRHPGRALLWGHGGSDPGINSNLRLRFEDGVAAVVLMNGNIGRPSGIPAPLEFAEYLVEHCHEF